MDDNSRFCTSCGKEIDSQTTYCPTCGSSVSDAPTPAGAQWKAAEDRYAEEKFKLSMMLLFIGAIASLLIGIALLGAIDSLVDTMMDAYESMKMEASEEGIRNMILISGYSSIACGAVCLIAGLLVRMRQNWIIAFLFAIIATVLGFYTTVVGGIFGVLVCWYLYKYKDAFEIGQSRNVL